MRRRWTADKIAHFLTEADRDLAKGLTVLDVCRKASVRDYQVAARGVAG
jgi:hypothetical protein